RHTRWPRDWSSDVCSSDLFEETSVDPRIAAPNKASAYRHYTTHDYAVFAQDDWKVTSRLTVNLGLRWERFGAPSEVHGIIAQFRSEERRVGKECRYGW